jgi:tight adherence protein C
MPDIVVPVLIVVGLALVLGLGYVGLKQDTSKDPLQERLAQFASAEKEMPQSLQAIEESLSFQDRIVLPMLRNFAKLTVKFTPEKQLEESRRLIELSNSTMEPAAFFALRIGVTVALTLLAILVFWVMKNSQTVTNKFLFTVGAAGLGYFLPVMLMQSKVTRRQQAIVKALPDALDLLVICVEAGLGFDAAMGKVYEKWENELAIAFGRVLREIQLGKLRRDALRDMASRMDVPDVTAFTAAIIQADQLGVSMAKILRVQSDQMRVKRRQRAQEKAHQAPVKMMLPMVLLIFPSIWIVLLGPSIIILQHSTLP